MFRKFILMALLSLTFLSPATAQSISPKQSLQFIEPTKISVFVPIDHPYLYKPSDPQSIVRASPSLGKILELLRKSSPVGKLANYDSVYELSIGIEGFTPLSSDNPGKGEFAMVPSVKLVIYSEPEVDQKAIDAFLIKMIAVHPWEYPVVEIADRNGIRLWTSKIPGRNSN